MTSASTTTALDLTLRLLAFFLALFYPLLYIWLYRGQPVHAFTLLYPALIFLAVALCLALASDRDHPRRRVIAFAAAACYFLDFQTGWFNGAVAAIASLCVLALCWLLREHLTQILLALFGAIFFSSLLIDPSMQYREQVVETADSGAAGAADDVLVHLILDEFTGLDGIPGNISGGTELRKELERFFQKHQMAVYAGAFSEYVSTRASISSILNFEATPTPWENYRGKNPYVLLNNAYFESLRQRGYKIHVYQSTYLDYCRLSPVSLASCMTFRYDGTDWLQNSGLTERDKLGVLLGIYLNHPGAMEWFWKSYTNLRDLSANLGVSLPGIMTWDGRVSSLASVSAFNLLRKDLQEAGPGDAYFAHVLLPHSPYALEADCSLRSAPLLWRNHHPLQEKDNNDLQREQSYRQYFEQVRCTVAMLETLFDDIQNLGLWDRTRVVLHGDHGSRIFRTSPKAKNTDIITPADLSDGFSTLFAVKLPTGEGSIIEGRRPISELLPLAAAGISAAQGADDTFIFLEKGGKEDWQRTLLSQ